MEAANDEPKHERDTMLLETDALHFDRIEDRLIFVIEDVRRGLHF